MTYARLPAGELIRQGIEDLAQGIESVPALLVSIGAPRLRQLGVSVPDTTILHPEHRLYGLLSDSNPDAAHGRYNALVRRLVSFEHTLACVR